MHAHWAGDKNDRHSMTENLFLIARGPISWLSKKQAVVALRSRIYGTHCSYSGSSLAQKATH